MSLSNRNFVNRLLYFLLPCYTFFGISHILKFVFKTPTIDWYKYSSSQIFFICLTPRSFWGLIYRIGDILVHHALIGRYNIYTSKINQTLPNLKIFSPIFLNFQAIKRLFPHKTNTIKKFQLKWNASSEL